MWREPRYERVRERKYGDEGMEERAQLLYPLEERVLNESLGLLNRRKIEASVTLLYCTFH